MTGLQGVRGARASHLSLTQPDMRSPNTRPLLQSHDLPAIYFAGAEMVTKVHWFLTALGVDEGRGWINNNWKTKINNTLFSATLARSQRDEELLWPERTQTKSTGIFTEITALKTADSKARVPGSKPTPAVSWPCDLRWRFYLPNVRFLCRQNGNNKPYLVMLYEI